MKTNKLETTNTELLNDVRTEVLDSFTKEEMEAYASFEDFWGDVDVMNAYEEEWPAWKKQGIKAFYKLIFIEMRK